MEAGNDASDGATARVSAGTDIADRPVFADRFASFVHTTTLDDVPPAAVERARYILLDTVGIMLGATAAPEMTSLRASLAHVVGGHSTVFGETGKASAPVAALLNGALTTVLQFDEGHRESMGHPAIHIVPAALAVAEEVQSSGKDLINALIVGYEVATRVGRSAFPLRGQLHPHGNWPTIGAALAVGKLLHLSKDQLAQLVDCAAMVNLFSWRRATVDGATIHHLLPGLAAQNAIVVAHAVRSGLSGPSSSLTEFLLPLVSERPMPALLDADLGSRWETLENYFKPYPACAHAHSAIAAMQELLNRYPIDAADILGIHVATYPLAATLHERAPRNQLAGMFSIPYNLGILIARRGHDLEGLARQASLSDDALEIARRVTVQADATLVPAYPAGRPCRVEVRLNDGTVLSEFMPAPPPLATAEGVLPALRNKFRDLASKAMSPDSVDALLDNLLAIERLPSVRVLFH